MKKFAYVLFLAVLGLCSALIVLNLLNRIINFTFEKWCESLFVERNISDWIAIVVMLLFPIVTTVVCGLTACSFWQVLLAPVKGFLMGFMGYILLMIAGFIYMCIKTKLILALVLVPIICGCTTRVVVVIVDVLRI